MNCKSIYIIILILFSFLVSQCQDYVHGDANNDNSLDIIDVIIMIDVIFGMQEIGSESIDLNSDSIINIYDIVVLIERILYPFSESIQIDEIFFDFHSIQIMWNKSNDYGFEEYKLYYANFIDNEQILLFSSAEIDDTTFTTTEITLNEQNYFWISVEDFTGCELMGEQFIYELPYKNYQLNELGNIEDTEFTIDNFRPSNQCISCHEEHYNEWFSSMHSYTMRSPIFFSYKESVVNQHSITGERFCMQCHNPVSFLTGEDLTNYNNVEDFQSSNLDQVIKDGIGCDVCHTMTGLSQTVFSNETFAANATYKMYPLGNIKFGPIVDPEENDYHDSYYLPTYKSSQMCLPCHDLVINDIEAEITFSEWARIPGFSMFGGVSCQECHMPLKENGYHSHKFIGVDLDLSIPILDNPLYQETSDLLSTSAELEFSIWDNSIPDFFNAGDSITIPLTIRSLTAHNLPSGTSFNREAWIELILYNNEQILFSTGNISNIESLDYNDPNLVFFTSFLFDDANNPTHDITNIQTMENFSLGPYQERFNYYTIYIPENIQGDIQVSARFLFRPFKPNFINEHHSDFTNNLPIFEIDSINSTLYNR